MIKCGPYLDTMEIMSNGNDYEITSRTFFKNIIDKRREDKVIIYCVQDEEWIIILPLKHNPATSK